MTRSVIECSCVVLGASKETAREAARGRTFERMESSSWGHGTRWSQGLETSQFSSTYSHSVCASVVAVSALITHNTAVLTRAVHLIVWMRLTSDMFRICRPRPQCSASVLVTRSVTVSLCWNISHASSLSSTLHFHQTSQSVRWSGLLAIKYCCIYAAEIYTVVQTRGQSNLTKSASRGAHSPVRGHPRGSKVVPLNSWGRISY